MSTSYWQTHSQSLGESYLSPDQLPQMLLVEEGDKSSPYFDSQNFATIGIGVNLTVPDNMALVLQQLGVLKASQTVSQQQQLVAYFEGIVVKNSPPAAGPDSTTLQTALNTALHTLPGFGGASFALNKTQAEILVTEIIKGYSIAAVNGVSFVDAGKQAQLDAILLAHGSPIKHDTEEYKALMSLFYNSLYETGPNALIGPKLPHPAIAPKALQVDAEVALDSLRPKGRSEPTTQAPRVRAFV